MITPYQADDDPQDPLTPEQIRQLWLEFQRERQRAQQKGGSPTPSDRAPLTDTRVPVGYGDNYLGGLVRTALQGPSLTMSDEAEAGIPTGFGLWGDYKGRRDAIRNQISEFSRDNPALGIAAPMAAGMLTQSALLQAAQKAPGILSVMRPMGLAPKASATMTQGQRILEAAKSGAKVGAITGVGSAKEMRDIPTSMAANAAAGGVIGGLFGTIGEAVGGARNLAAQVGRDPAKPQGRVARAVQEEAPQVAAVRRVLARMGAGNVTVDDVITASRTAPPDMSLAEIIDELAAAKGGSKQGVAGLRIARNVGTRRTDIDEALADRAAEGRDKLSRIRGELTGVNTPRDPKVVAQEAMDAVAARADALYRRSYQEPDVPADPILPVVEKLAKMRSGRTALTRASELSAGFDALQDIDPASPMISVENLHNLRQGVDFALQEAEKAGDAQMVRILTQARRQFDAAYKEAGGRAAVLADRLWERASARGESFAAGQKVELLNNAEAIQAAKANARNPEFFRRGAASKAQERTLAVTDDAGQIRNPVPAAFGGETRRAREAVGYKTPEDFNQARERVKAIVRDFMTRQQVSGNSATAANLGEAAAEFGNNSDQLLALMEAPFRPASAVQRLGQKGLQTLGRGVSAAQADEMGRILGAGLPNQMTRDQANVLLKQMEPALRAQLEAQIRRRGTSAGLLAGLGIQAAR